MTNNLTNKFFASAALMAMLSLSPAMLLANNTSTEVNTPEQDLIKQVRRELNTLPFIGIFDHLAFSLDGRTVTLHGYATRPVLKSDAENVVKRLKGVEEVVNNIEVLPLSPNDDQLRLAVYRSVFSRASLGRYTLGALPPVRIIVKNGDVTFYGVVINEMDKNMFTVFANQVPGVFKVTNNLRVETRS